MKRKEITLAIDRVKKAHDKLSNAVEERPEDAMKVHKCAVNLLCALLDYYAVERENQKAFNQVMDALWMIHDYPANENSDPDVMGKALNDIHKIAAAAINPQDRPDLPTVAEIAVQLQTMTAYLAEAHAEDKAADHYGDDSCSYCRAIDETNKLLERCGLGITVD